MLYSELKKQEQDRISSVPIVWGFSDQQIRDSAESKGFEITELKPIGAGGYMRPQDKHLLDEAYAENERIRNEWLQDPKNLQHAFEYELANHEYCISYDDIEVWVAVGLSKVNSTKEQREVYAKAVELYLASVVCW